jgi:hypothetical protein
MSRCFTWFPFGELREPNIYQNLVCFTRMWGFYLELCLTVKNLWELLTGDDDDGYRLACFSGKSNVSG